MKSIRPLVLALLTGLFSFPDAAHSGGLTILTHGFASGTDDWVKEMADAIAARTAKPGSPVILNVVMDSYFLPLTGQRIPYVEDLIQVSGPSVWSDEHNGEVIMKIDWSEIDALRPVVSAETVGQVVADYLLTQPINNHLLIEQPIHLLGHSRGTAVNSALAHRLAERKVWVDHTTMLDLYPVVEFSDGKVGCWNNIRFAENWYTKDWWPHGEFIAGAQNCDLSTVIAFTIEELCEPHQLVHTFFHGTIQTAADEADGCTIRNAWYSEISGSNRSGPRGQVGFFWSRLGAASALNPAGTVYRPKAGLPSILGGSGQRISVTASGTAWPNIEIDGLLDDRQIAQNSGFGLRVRYSSPTPNATTAWGFDHDGNPYNGVAATVLSTLLPDASDDFPLERTLDTQLLQANSTYSIFVSINVDGFTRYYYAPGRVTVQAANASPTAMELTCTASPGTVAPNFPVTVSGTATYNNGGGLVSAGTVTISVGGREWTASIQNGMYSRSVTAPGTAGNFQVLAVASDGAGRSGSASDTVVVDPDEPTSGYVINDFLTCQFVESQSPYDWIGRIDAFGADDSRLYVWLEVGNIQGLHPVDFRLYRPDGTFYGHYSATLGQVGQTHEWWRMYAYWPVEDTALARTPGRWKVKLIIDGGAKRSLYFTMRYELTEHLMARDVQNSAPFDPANIFTQTDQKALAWLKLEKVSNPLDVKWVFTEPNGSPYTEPSASSPDPDASGLDYWDDWRFWGWINLAGHSAANKCGDWTVDVFIRNPSGNWDKQYTDHFRLLESPLQPPSCSVSLDPATPRPGQALTLTISASDNTYLKNVTVHWNDGVEHAQPYDTVAGSLNQSLNIGPYAEGQQVEFWATATDTSGNAAESSHHTVEISTPQMPPAIVIQPQSLSILAGETATFSVTASGSFPLTYRWKKGNVPPLADDAHFSGAATASLTINNVQAADAGDYSVVVRNGAGEVVSDPAILTVRASLPWVLQLPFDPAVQDTVLAAGQGVHNREGLTQAAEAFAGRLFYAIYGETSATPSKVYRFDPSTSENVAILDETEDQFRSIKAMNGLLWVSHSNGKVWTSSDGIAFTLLQATPFTAENYVTAMNVFNGRRFFATSAGEIYEHESASGFLLKTTIRAGKPTLALQEWKGHFYGANSEDYSQAAKIFRTADGQTWTMLSTNDTFTFYGFVATDDYLYLASVEDPNGASMALRGTSDGLNWSRFFFTNTEGKGVNGRPTYFSQTGRVYFLSEWENVPRLFPVVAGAVEPRSIMRHGFASVVEVDGRLFGIGFPHPATDRTHFVVSVLGNYSPAGSSVWAMPMQLGESVIRLTLMGENGWTYVVEASSDLVNWTPFATNVIRNGTVDFHDTGVVGSKARFYRAVAR